MYELTQLFSVPLYRSGDNLPKKCVDYVKNIEYNRTVSNNGYISNNNYVLEDKNLVELKNIATKHLNIFTKDILKIKKDLEFYITTSWCVKHDANDFAYKHNHSNSLISGVIYLHTDIDSGEITFHKSLDLNNIFYPNINIEYEENNILNCESISIKPMIGDIVLFPSHLIHSVSKSSSKERYVLAFNSFIKGSIGEGIGCIKF